MLKLFLRHVRRFPWVTNVTLYGCLFAGGDFVHQWFSGRETIEWRQTRNVAVVAFSFHGNFNFFWMRFLERRFPGNSIGMVMRKLFLDQTTAAPLATSVFYTGRWAVGGTGWRISDGGYWLISQLIASLSICNQTHALSGLLSCGVISPLVPCLVTQTSRGQVKDMKEWIITTNWADYD